MASNIVAEDFKFYTQALFVRNISGASAERVSFYSVNPQLKSSDWITLVDLDDVGEITDTEKMVLIDCVKLPLLNSLAALSSDKLVVAVLCLCRDVTEKELRMSPQELMSEDYPPILILLEKNTDVIELKQLLLLNPREVECSIRTDQSDAILSPLDPHAVGKRSNESGFTTGYDTHQGSGKYKMRESIIQDTLDNILFTKVKEDDLLPLTLCRNPELISLVVNFIHQKVDSHAHDKKDNLRHSMNKIVKYLKSRVIFENRIQIDRPIYLVIFLEIGQLYDGSKGNQAHEAIDYILNRFLNSPTSTIVTSIQRFSELSKYRAFKFRKTDSPVTDLITLFTIEYTQCHKSGNKYLHMKPITKLQDLKNKLMWYSVLMLCNQSFHIPGHSKWNEHLIRHVDHDQLSIYDSSNLNVIWEFGIQFGLKLGLSLEQRFLLSHVMKLVSSNSNIYTFQNFNTILDYILKYQYDYLEIADFSHEYFLFLHQYSTVPKKQMKSLLDDNPKGCVETMCVTLSKLSTLICTATGVAKDLVNPYDVLKKSWFDTFSLLLDNVVCYYLYETYNPKDCAIVLRFFYDAIKIPHAPEELVKPWIKEYKKQVVLMITHKFHRIDIATFHEILTRFRVTVLSKTAIYDYFTKYQPSQGTCLKDHVWQELMVTLFKPKDPPKSIFLSLQKIFDLYLQRNCGFQFICDCLELDLPGYGVEYILTKEDTLVSNFKNFIEQRSHALLISKLHNNLMQILNYIPKLRLPSLLQAVVMDALIHAIVPGPSLLVHSNKDGYCKQLIVSLQTLSYQKDNTTYEQLKISYQHYYLWKIIALISKRIIFEDLEWSNFPYMVTTLMFVFNKYCDNVIGFQGYAWEDKNLGCFIDFCKKSGDIISRRYQDILNDDCSLLEYTNILNNLTNLNQLFKNCNLEILSTEIIQDKIRIFTYTAKGLTSTIFLQLQIEDMDAKSSYILSFLNDHQVEVSEGIRMEIELLVNICYKQVTGKNDQICLIPVLEPKDTIKLKEFKSRCVDITETFGMFTSPISEGSNCSVHKFLAHFSLRDNQLFDACLRKCMADKLPQISGKQYFSMEEFVECSIDCFEVLNKICQGESTYADIEYINEHLTLQTLDFDKIQTDMKLFPPLADQIKGNLGVINLFQLLKISDYLVYIANVCKQYTLLSCIASPEFSQLENIYSKLSNRDNRNTLTITQATELLEQVNQITSYMPIQRYQLFPILEDSAEFYKFLFDKKLHNNRDSFDIQVNLITSERQDEDYDDTVLTHLSIAYNYMIPLFDQEQTLSAFLKNYSLMKIGSETRYSQLRTVNNNITLIRRWFIIAEGETTENVSQQLQDIIDTGQYEILLGNSDNPLDLGPLPSLASPAPSATKKQIASIILKYSASTNIAAMRNIKRDSVVPPPESPVDVDTNSRRSLNAVHNRVDERLTTEKIDEFVRKLGFLEPTKLTEQRVKCISDFQYFHEMIRKMFEYLTQLVVLGHPNYQDKPITIHCSTERVKLSEILDKYALELTQWQESYAKIQKNVEFLLFFPIQRIISTVSLMEAKSWSQAANQLSFLFKNDFNVFQLIEATLLQEYYQIKMKLEEDKDKIISPAEVMSIVISNITSNTDLSPKLLISSTRDRSKSTVRGPQGDFAIIHQTQNIHRLHGCTQSQVLALIQRIYKNLLIESYQLLHCNADTSFEELSLFLARTNIFLKPTYCLIEVNKLPNILQEYTMKHIAESQRESKLIAAVHYIETAQSLLHELPGVKVEIHTHLDQLTVLPNDAKSIVFDEIELVYGLEGDGKSHYIRKRIKPYQYNIVIPINEAFSVPAVIEKMNHTIPLDIDVCIYFNFTITCQKDSDKKSKDYLEYEELMRRVNWFFFDLLVLNYVSDSSSSLIFRVPSGLHWKLFIEVPSRPDISNSLVNLTRFRREIPIFSIMGTPQHIGNDELFEIDDDVQLICKYLQAYTEFLDKKGKGINRLYDDRKQARVIFSTQPNLPPEECYRLLDRYMEAHVKVRKILQKLFVRYMLRRCNVLEHLPYFIFNTGKGVMLANESEKRVITDTRILGSTLMRTMILEVNQFCDPTCKEDWGRSEHQQLIYNTSGGGHTIKFLSLHPEKLNSDVRADFNSIGINIPSHTDLGTRKRLEELLAHAISIEKTETISKLIEEEEYVLTVDFLLKMLNIHERRMCKYPVVLVGETGVGKTKLLEFLSKLWNKTVHAAYYKALDSIIDILKKKINQIFYPEQNLSPTITSLDILLALNDAISSRTVPTYETTLKCCVELYEEIMKPLEGFCRTPAFNLLKIDRVIAEQAVKFYNPENTARFLNEILSAKPVDTFIKINVHSALTPADIKLRFTEIIEKATELAKPLIGSDTPRDMTYQAPIVTIFLDEINTSHCLGLFKEIVIDGYIDGEKLPDNVFIVAACNPHRSVTATLQQDTKLEDWILGWYYVRQIHPTLTRILWDYGALNEFQEMEYIKQKFAVSNLKTGLTDASLGDLSSQIGLAQQLVRIFAENQLIKVGFSSEESKIRAKSCVSQRDIQRVFKITEFLHSIDQNRISSDIDIEHCILVAIGLVYYLRLDEFFRSKFNNEMDKSFGLTFGKTLNKYIDSFIDNVKVPAGIAKTKALKENLFATLICTMSKIPLIIVGAPGTSKTLSFNLAISNVKGGESPKEYFRNKMFPALEPHYYQCSRRSTSNEIENVFKIAIKRQETHDEANLNVFSVVFMDEAGLPEESHESLKVLHYFLDRPKVSFVAISNHILDAAKSNRAINLFRPQQQDDLYTLATGCYTRSVHNRTSVMGRSQHFTVDRSQHFISRLCVPYEDLMKQLALSKFFGLRDFIHMISYLRRNRDKSDPKEELVLRAVERNFNGQETEKFAKIAGLFVTNEVYNKHSRNIIEVLRESLEDKSIRPVSRKNKQGDEEELIEVRYKMIIDPSEDDSLTRLLYHYNILNIKDTRMFIGSDFPGDGELQKVILISAIKHAAAEGKTVILSQADEIYENFYDLFNQNYKQVEDNKGRRYYANIAIGSHSKPCRVDPNFQCIVHIQKSFLEYAPQPFLNRFEKFYVSQKDLLRASLEALPPCMEIMVNRTIEKVKDFIQVVKKQTFYGNIYDSFESLLIDMLPKPGFNYDEVKRRRAYEPAVIEPEDTPEEDEDQHRVEYPPSHEYLDVLLSHLTILAGFNFIYLPVEERNQIAVDILRTATYIDPIKDDVEVGNLASTIRGNPESLEQFIPGAIEHLMKEHAPMCDEDAHSAGLFLLHINVTPGQRLVISMIVHFLVRYLCTRLLQLALPEALIVKYDLISETYKRTYLVHQNHFEFKNLITRCVKLQKESNEKDLLRPSKLLCYTRTTSFILSLPNSFPPDQHMQAPTEEEWRHINPVIHERDDTTLFKLSAIRTQEQFMTILREYFNNAKKRVLLFVADMQHVTQQRINFVRIMVDEEESVAATKVGEFSLNKFIVILLHYPPTIFNRTHHKSRNGSFSGYPAHFLHGWDHCYLDNLQKQKENNPLNIQNWLTLTLLSHEDELKKIKGPMLESLCSKIPQQTIDILSRIRFGTNLRCVFNSVEMDLYQRAEALQIIFERTEVGLVLCESFISYWKSDFIREQIHNYANSIFQNLSNLSLTDLVVTSFWNLFTSFLTLMVYRMNEGLNMEVLFEQLEMPTESTYPDRIYEKIPASIGMSREHTKHLFLGILKYLSKPSMEEVKNISHILDAQVNNAIHVPKFPFSIYVTRTFNSAIQSSIQEVNNSLTTTRVSDPNQGLTKPTQEDLNKFLLENLKKNLHRYPLIQFILENVKGEIWTHYLEDFAYNNISISSANLLNTHENISFLSLVHFWGNDFDRNDISNALLKLHISAFANPPDFSKLLYIFSSLEKLNDPHLQNIDESIQGIVQPQPCSKSLPIFSYFIDTLYQNFSKMFSRPNSSNIDNIKQWVGVYINLIIQFVGSTHSDALEYTLSDEQKKRLAQMHSLYLICKYYTIDEKFILNAFDLAIYVKVELRGGYDLIKIFNKGLKKVEEACKQTKQNIQAFKVHFAEGILHHLLEQNDVIEIHIICWILHSANRQYVWSGAAARQIHSQVKPPVKEEIIIEPGLLTFRFYQYIITKFLLSEAEDTTDDTAVNITQFNRDVKMLIADELLVSCPVTEPTEYIPFYYDVGPRSFIKCSADIHITMKQPLAHLYYQIALDRLQQLHGDKKLLNIFKLYQHFLNTNLSIDKDNAYKVIARIEKQALFQVILWTYSGHFNPNNSSAVLNLIELHPECVKEIHSHIDDHTFGGAALGGHSWTMLYLISNKFFSMNSYEQYLEKLKHSKDELPWLYSCVTKLQKIEQQKIPQFPFMNPTKDKRYKSYKECYDLIRCLSLTTDALEEDKLIEDIRQLATRVSQQERTALCYLRMYFWLAIYQEFYLQNISCEKLYCAIQKNTFSQLGLSAGKRRIILCFLNTDSMIRTPEVLESLNPDNPIYELEEGNVRLKQKTGEKKTFLFNFFSQAEKDHDTIILRNILCNLIAVFIALPHDTSHLNPLFLEPQKLLNTYIVSNLYPKPISPSLKYDCGCELNEDGGYGRPDYYSFDRKSFTLHSFYLMTLMNFGALSVSLVTQPDTHKHLSSQIFSEWKEPGVYCLSQLRTIWLHMQLQWEQTQEELGEFLTLCFYEYFLLVLEDNSPLKPTIFQSTQDVEMYEYAIHTRVYEKTLKQTTDVRTRQQVISEFSNNVVSFRKWYPAKVTFPHLQHTIESCRPVNIKEDITVNNFAILHRFICERKRFRICSILLPNLIKFYRLFHTNLNYFITRKEAESKSIQEVIEDITKKSRPLVNIDIKELYKRILYFYRLYYNVCRGLIGYGPCGAIRREEKFLPLRKDTKFIRLLSFSDEPGVGFDDLYLVIQDLISTQNEFIQTVRDNKKLLPWLCSYDLETSTITPTEENTRNAFVSDLTSNEINQYWTSMKEVDESSLEILELIRSRTNYTPFQNTGTSPYDLTSLEQDIFWKYIASKPKFNTETNLIHKIFKFKEVIISNLPDPLNLQQFLLHMKNYLKDQSNEYLTPLPESVVQNLEYHFHTLDYTDFCRLLNALRQTIQRLAQSSIMAKGNEEQLLHLSLVEFLMKQSSNIDAGIKVLHNAGFTEFNDQQSNILATDITVNILYSCMEFFLHKFDSRSYEYCKLPYCVKTSLPNELSSQISDIGQKLEDILRTKDGTKNELEQLLTTLQHCEQTFIQSPQSFIKKTLLTFQFYDENDSVIKIFPDKIQNAHYVPLVGSLQRCIMVINQKLIERLEKREAHTNEWREQIVDFWLSLPHFWDGETMDEHVDSEIDFTIIHANPDYSIDLYQHGSGEVYRSGGGDDNESLTSFGKDLTDNVDIGASYDIPFV